MLIWYCKIWCYLKIFYFKNALKYFFLIFHISTSKNINLIFFQGKWNSKTHSNTSGNTIPNKKLKYKFDVFMTRYVFCLNHVLKNILLINTNHGFARAPLKRKQIFNIQPFFSKTITLLSHIYDSIFVWN